MNTCRILAVKTETRRLKPGDIYSDKGPEYWNRAMAGAGMVPQAWVWPNAGVEALYSDEIVYKLTIIQESVRDAHVKQSQFNPHAPPGEDEGDWVHSLV